MASSLFPDQLRAEIRKEFGEHCMRRRDYKKANENFEASLQLQPNKLDFVYRLANSEAREANLDSALKLLSEKSKLESFKDHFNCNLQECDCNYEKNLFEKSLLLVSEETQRIQNEIAEIPHASYTLKMKQRVAKIKGPKLKPLKQRFETIQTNFDDMIGKNAGNCLFEQRKYFDKIVDSSNLNGSYESVFDNDAEPFGVNSPSNADDCDVVSIFEENVQKKTIKEKHRVEHLRRKFAQCYMQSAWKDFVFINGLKSNKDLLKSTQNDKSFDIINREIDDCVETTGRMIQQLHARCPLYTYSNKMFPNSAQKAKANKISKFHSQYLIRRETFLALDEMHKMRADGKLEKLIKLAEHELGVRYQINSDKLMPRKKEFLTEICNLIGLALLDRLKLPLNSMPMSGLQQLAAVFEVSIAGKKVVAPYVFGDQSTYRDPAEPDTAFLVYKRKVTRLEQRIKQSSMPMEKCHLYHEMGRQNLTQKNYEETRNFGRKIIVEAAAIGSYLWKFLGQVLICRAFLAQKNFIEMNDNLKVALKLVDVFGNPELRRVIEFCVKTCGELMM